MKVKVSEIRPNPYRNIQKYKIDREKVESLKTSIGETGFWDNILLRKVGGEYQLAYGHHRLQAVKELGIDEIDVPVKDIDNANMLRIMANENLEAYNPTTGVVNETVAAAKDFIDEELARYETWEGYRSAKNSIPIDSEPEFRSVKGKGAGRNIICAFLGGNWKPWMVEAALRVIGDDGIDREAVESFPTLNQAKTFMNAVKRNGVPKEEQADLADMIIKDGKDSRREMKRYFHDIEEEEPEATIYEPVVIDNHEEFSGVDIDRAVSNNAYALRQVMAGLEEVLQNWDSVSEESQAEYMNAFSEFLKINYKYFKGEKRWTELQLNQ